MTKVVVIDESLPVQRSLRRLLEEVPGFEVAGFAWDTEGAIALIDSTRPEVVVLDVDPRDADRAMDVLHHVTSHHPQTRVVALSYFNWPALRDAFLQAGASAYFDKSMEFTLARDWIAAHVRAT